MSLLILLDELKEKNEAPQWMTEAAYSTLSRGYLLPNETPKDMWKRVSTASALRLGKPEKAQVFFDLFWNNWLGGASPVLSNMGTERGLPISCYSQHVPDSIEGIFDKVKELAILSKNGGGVGVYYGDVRGRGAPIKGNGFSEGVIPWLRVNDSSVYSVAQGSTRRGSAAIYLPIEHLDIEEFIKLRQATGDFNRRCLNLNHAISITDKWMKEMLAGDVKKKTLWLEILNQRFETGEPYLFFHDNVNNQLPECYTKNGLDVKTSNLCLSQDTLITTKKGVFPIKSLVGKTVEIFDGKSWVENSSFRKIGTDELYRIYLSDGSYVDSTADHTWYDYSKNNRFKTNQLTNGMKLEIHNKNESNRVCVDFNRIEKIEKLEGTHEVYCTTVPSTSKFALANGLMTGNCSEIFLHTDPDHTFVCCLSSMNLARYDEWKNTSAVSDATWFLEGVMEEFIQKSKKISGMEAAVRFAEKSRALGLGVMGWHTLLQNKNLPFDSFESMMLNAEIFRHMRSEAEKATEIMAKEYGEPDWCKGFNRRHTHLLAVAPTVSNSTISGGISAGIEPIAANIYAQKSAKGNFIIKNKKLEELLEQKGKNEYDIWKSINEFKGSVQHLSFLTEDEKKIFLTAREINQFAIVKQAAQRQKWIDQGQSVNLFFAANSDPKYIHEVHLEAWQSGLKSLYYLRSEGVLKGDMASRSKDECEACSG